LAPQVGLEPTTLRLTAECSAPAPRFLATDYIFSISKMGCTLEWRGRTGEFDNRRFSDSSHAEFRPGCTFGGIFRNPMYNCFKSNWFESLPLRQYITISHIESTKYNEMLHFAEAPSSVPVYRIHLFQRLPVKTLSKTKNLSTTFRFPKGHRSRINRQPAHFQPPRSRGRSFATARCRQHAFTQSLRLRLHRAPLPWGLFSDRL
jgi:hypothetical protein